MYIIFFYEFTESAYYKKYLESFPLKYNEKNNSVGQYNNGFLVPIAIRKYKKVRKKYSSNYAENIQDEHRESNNDEQYFVGFTKNPFGHSSPFSRYNKNFQYFHNINGDSSEIKHFTFTGLKYPNVAILTFLTVPKLKKSEVNVAWHNCTI